MDLIDQDLLLRIQGMMDPEDSPSILVDQGEMEIAIAQDQTMRTTQHPQTFPQRIGCWCNTCNQIKSDCQEIKKMLEKLDMKRIHEVFTQ